MALTARWTGSKWKYSGSIDVPKHVSGYDESNESTYSHKNPAYAPALKKAQRKARNAYTDDLQDESDAIAREYRRLGRQQKGERDELEALAAESLAAANSQAEALTVQHDQRIAGMRAARDQSTADAMAATNAANAATGRAQVLRAEAVETGKRVRAAGQAVSSSLGVLANRQGRQGQTAVQSRRGKRGRGAATTMSSLAIGSTGRSAGSGSNLSI
tara:strand:+ start:45 stop:692 length:648 start_codon:yes stop_codon:yes gene_type:complete